MGSQCTTNGCTGAHSNYASSVVRNPKWCLRGHMMTCPDERCPFNHFRSEILFVQYRMNDEDWAWNNVDLVIKYSRAFTFGRA